MKYKDYGFRPLYKNFCVFPINDVIKKALEGEKGIDEADGVMVYGYVDHVAGNSIELVALTKREEGDKYSFIKLPDDARFFARVEHLAGEEFEFAAPGNSHLYEKFKFKIDRLALYDVNEDVAKSREMTFLDEFRYENSFDDVKVILHKDGLQLEGVWVKIEKLGKGIITGTLMNEPKQDFGVTTGSPIAFLVNEGKDKNRSLVSDLTLRRKYTAKELADGKILKGALEAFKEDKNKFKLYAILEMLRDSKVLVPETKKGIEILTAENRSYFPVFTESMEMWQCEDGITKTEMTFMEAVKKAKKNKKVSGIVVNGYSDGFAIPRSMFDIFEDMNS